mmetsp:Transcript_10083/g.40894  ORF Transcript_10083/g.40894 Transcript_10083/m.40894 type:complete len:299 (+) Transcript_10083:1165-2061(+)
MRVAVARALFIQPDLLLLDEPTNHLDMEAVVWLEDYLSRWSKMLFMVCHSHDCFSSVCSHVVHLDHHSKRLVYYKGNDDQFVETRRDAMTEQLKRYQAEQDDIKAMKEYVARFGHGAARLARQGKSHEKLLNQKLSSGLTFLKPVEDERFKFKFPDPGALPPPVLQVNSLTFGYPGCPDLYTDVDTSTLASTSTRASRSWDPTARARARSSRSSTASSYRARARSGRTPTCACPSSRCTSRTSSITRWRSRPRHAWLPRRRTNTVAHGVLERRVKTRGGARWEARENNEGDDDQRNAM